VAVDSLKPYFIPLLADGNQAKVKPYRYPHSQKAQIELMVAEMLTTSPFCSPLFVKKKDDITVKDNFMILTVDEFLDEFHGASHFSKLDLHYSHHQILVTPEDRHNHFPYASWAVRMANHAF
jgi:hypothetical protein